MRQLTASCMSLLQKLEALGDSGFTGIQLGGSGVGVDGVVDRIIVALVQGSKIGPDFRDVGVDANGAGVGVRVAVFFEV